MINRFNIADVLANRRRVTFEDIKKATKVGEAQFKYFEKYGEFPESKGNLGEFIEENKPL